MDKCAICCTEFVKRSIGRGYQKRKVTTELRRQNVTVQQALLELNPLQVVAANSYICFTCFNVVDREYHKIVAKDLLIDNDGIRADPSSPSQHSSKRVKLGTQNKRTRATWPFSSKRTALSKSVQMSLCQSKFHVAFRKLLGGSAAAKRAFVDIVRSQVKSEMRLFLQSERGQNSIFPRLHGTESIDSFSWNKLVPQLAAVLPILCAALTGSMPTKMSTTDNETRSLMNCRIGMLLTVPLYSHQPVTFKFVQALNGIQMWRCGASNKLFKCFNRLGICQGSAATRRNVDFFVSEMDSIMKTWKTEVEDRQQINEDRLDFGSDAESEDTMDIDYKPNDNINDISTSDLDSSCVDDQPNSYGSDDGSVAAPDVGVGYAIVWDNTQKLVTVRNQSREHKNKMMLWANAYAVKNRVDFRHLDSQQQVLSADIIPLSSYLPNLEDREEIRRRMTIVVSRILCEHVPFFANASSVPHIAHRYSEQSSKKSETVNLGIIDENPSTTAGTIAIMSRLHRYVPKKPDSSPLVVPTHGDCLAVERMIDSKKARSGNLTAEERLEGLEPIPQEFHHRGLMLQDTMDMLFSGRSEAERGTMSQLKNDFGHRNVTKDVMNSFNHADNFMRFLTEAHVVYLAMHLTGMVDIEGTPNVTDFTNCCTEVDSYLINISNKIVDAVWLMPSIPAIQEVLDSDCSLTNDSEWCICHANNGDDMVRCCNADCPLGSWFHASCLHIDHLPRPDEDWFCSLECRQCALTEVCQKVDQTSQEDCVRNYAVTLTWCGLMDLCQKDAVREADGLAMMSLWRANMIRFWNGNHYKYLNVGHRLLAGISGWWCPRLIEEIIHNRTVNIRGRPGHNIAMDRVCEFLNAEFKETLKYSHGSYTGPTINRAGKIVGSVARSLDAAFHNNICETDVDTSFQSRFKYNADVRSFVTEYRDAELFSAKPGREHPSFPGFKCCNTVKKPDKLKQRLIEYTAKLKRTRIN